ncbi:MAG TPA: carbohydrate ABC transporter permease [Candidatus Nitrosocosmicus sp.]|nr:carbohydrate ABC transporter permease [Candidatus Nitrosocosmicus sp.]
MKDRYLSIKYVLLCIFAVAILVPLVIVFFGAFKSSGELFNNPFGIPHDVVFGNFKTAFVKGNMVVYFRNTIFVAAVSLVLILAFSCIAAYAVTRNNFKFADPIYYYFMFGLTIPVQVIMIPSYLMMAGLHLVNNIWSLVIIYVSTAMSFSVFILSGFFRTVPVEMEEAATIDGCSEMQAFTKVILPLCKPAVSTILIFNLLYIWNDLYNPLLFIRSENIKTLALGLTKYMGRYIANYPIMFAAIVIASLPVITVFLLLQKQFVAGITSGAVKG